MKNIRRRIQSVGGEPRVGYRSTVQPRLLATMVTTTTYGAWLPGDLRGYVDHGVILPGDPGRFQQAIDRMGVRSPVLLTPDQ